MKFRKRYSTRIITVLTDIIRVKLIHPHKGRYRRGPQTPLRELSNDRELACMQVIRNARIKLCNEKPFNEGKWGRERTHPDMTMHDQSDAQQPVQDRVAASGRHERGRGHGDERRREDALECPVVGSVHRRGRGKRGWVVDGSFEDG